MNAVLEARLRDLLEREPTRAMSLEALHRLLAAEVGPGASGYGRLRRAVADRPDAFVLLEPASPFGDGLTTELRAAYATALEMARIAQPARVALAVNERSGSPAQPGGVRRASFPPLASCEEGRDDDREIGPGRTLDQLEASLLVLFRLASADPALRTEIAAAFAHVDELRRRLAP